MTSQTDTVNATNTDPNAVTVDTNELCTETESEPQIKRQRVDDDTVVLAERSSITTESIDTGDTPMQSAVAETLTQPREPVIDSRPEQTGTPVDHGDITSQHNSSHTHTGQGDDGIDSHAIHPTYDNTTSPATTSAQESGFPTSIAQEHVVDQDEYVSTHEAPHTHSIIRTMSHSSYTAPSDHTDAIDSSVTIADAVDSSVTTSPSIHPRKERTNGRNELVGSHKDERSHIHHTERDEADSDVHDVTMAATETAASGGNHQATGTLSTHDNTANIDLNASDEDEVQVVFPCAFDGCRRVFDRVEDWRSHSGTHMSGKAFPCRWVGCGEGFSDAEALANHMFQHTALRCPRKGCEKMYASIHKLSAHVKLRHKSKRKRR
ncbi:hypothetical protein SARC_07466, partial [Sphaeroforma arctica JP610]